MKKVLFIGSGDMYRSKFAEAYFNNIGKLECLFILTHTEWVDTRVLVTRNSSISTNVDISESCELNKFSEEVCNGYLLYGSDCYTKEHSSISDDDFKYCDKIIVVSERAKRIFRRKL